MTVIAETKRGWVVLGAKGLKAGPYETADAAWAAFESGVTESCSDGACGAGSRP